MSEDEALVRPEIWAAARRYYDAGDWDKAIFDALKKVESLTQQQVGSALIGNGLFELAFNASYGQRVVISQDPRDIESLIKLFAGAIGIYKGDRSHGDEPAIKFDSPEECIRVLVVASALLDILDRDEARAPSVVSAHRPDPRTLELRVDRLSPATRILINGQPAQITWQTAAVVQVELSREMTGQLSIVAIDGSRKGKAFSYSLLGRLPSGENWHRVERVNVDVYSAQDLSLLLMVKAVLIRSCESGRQYVRAFPTRASYAVGDYLTWEWDTTASVGEAWMRVGGQPQLAWGASNYFAGQLRGRAGRIQRGAIQLRPAQPVLRMGHRLPLRVIAHYTDSVGDWFVDETGQASIDSDNQGVARVATTTGPVLVAKADGTAGLIAQIRTCHSRSEARVAASFKGRVTEFLGGYQRITKLADSPGGMLVTNQGDTIYRLRPDMGFGPFLRVDMPESAAYGVDYLASADNGDIYYRANWDSPNTVRKRLAASGHTTEERTSLPSGLVPMHIGWSAQTGAIIADHLGGLWTWADGTSVPKPWATRPWPGCMDIMTISSGVVTLLNTNVITEFDFDGKIVMQIALDDLQGKGVSALAKVRGSYFIACFNSGEVHEWAGGTLSRLAGGLSAPASLYALADDRLLVANFSGDSISEISI